MAFGSMAKPGVVSPLQVEELRGSSGPWIPGFLLGPLWIECFYWYRSWFDEVKSFLAKGCCQNPVVSPVYLNNHFLGWKPPLLDPNFEPKITIYSSFSPQLLFGVFFSRKNPSSHGFGKIGRPHPPPPGIRPRPSLSEAMAQPSGSLGFVPSAPRSAAAALPWSPRDISLDTLRIRWVGWKAPGV